MKQSINIEKVHALVWNFRALHGAVWPTPDRVDALRFAYCESAEALDAWLRQQARFNRNRQKSLHVLDELADTAIMLVTALGFGRQQHTVEREPVSLDAICGGVAFIFRCVGKGFADTFIERAIRETVGDIALYPGMDLEARVALRLEGIRARVTASTGSVGELRQAQPPTAGLDLREVVAGYADGLEE